MKREVIVAILWCSLECSYWAALSTCDRSEGSNEAAYNVMRCAKQAVKRATADTIVTLLCWSGTRVCDVGCPLHCWTTSFTSVSRSHLFVRTLNRILSVVFVWFLVWTLTGVISASTWGGGRPGKMFGQTSASCMNGIPSCMKVWVFVFLNLDVKWCNFGAIFKPLSLKVLDTFGRCWINLELGSPCASAWQV